MTERSSWFLRFLGELKRRRVFRVTAVYVVLAAGSLELLDVLIPETRLPEWTTALLLSLAVVGLPVVIVLAWTFDVTREGVVRTGSEEGRDQGDPTSGTQPASHATQAPDPPSATRAPPPGHVPPAAPLESGAPPGSPVPGSGPRSDPSEPLPGITAVAVLPFENMSGSDEAEPFAVGLHDDLLTELSRASALTVISRTSVRGYKGSDKGVRQIGRELGVGTIVEGGVQKVGNRVRLNIQVIDARTDTHRWAERYDRELTPEGIFDLQSELAGRIMESVATELTSEERARVHEVPTDDLEAYRLYSLGREALVDRTEEGMTTAASHFQRAIERDPEYAPAWAGLGIALVGLVDYGHTEEEETLERGIAALDRAVELDPELPEAHAGIGSLRASQQDGEGARKALSRAVELGPGLAWVHQWTSWVELLLGDPETAVQAGRRATQLDPLDPEARGNLAMGLLGIGKPGEASHEARRSLESHPEFAYGRWVLAMVLDELGQSEEAEVELETLADESLSPWDTFLPWARLGTSLRKARTGDQEGARDVASELTGDRAHFEAGILLAALGDLDDAFAALGRAAPFFWDDALALRYFRGRGLGEIRDDPRYGELLEELDRSWAG